MTTQDAYARLVALGVPVVETSDVATLLSLSTAAATMLLSRLARSGLVRRIRSGVWFVGSGPIDRYALLDALTAPMPSYLSLQTALYLHGMIEQIPAVVYAVSLGRSQQLVTSLGTYSLHHIAPELFGGFEEKRGAKVATPEKAVFDMAYFSGGRARVFARFPELELPSGFKMSAVRKWIARIEAVRRRAMVEARLERVLASRSR